MRTSYLQNRLTCLDFVLSFFLLSLQEIAFFFLLFLDTKTLFLSGLSFFCLCLTCLYLYLHMILVLFRSPLISFLLSFCSIFLISLFQSFNLFFPSALHSSCPSYCYSFLLLCLSLIYKHTHSHTLTHTHTPAGSRPHPFECIREEGVEGIRTFPVSIKLYPYEVLWIM